MKNIGIAVLQSSDASFFSLSFSLHSAMRCPGRTAIVQLCYRNVFCNFLDRNHTFKKLKGHLITSKVTSLSSEHQGHVVTYHLEGIDLVRVSHRAQLVV